MSLDKKYTAMAMELEAAKKEIEALRLYMEATGNSYQITQVMLAHSMVCHVAVSLQHVPHAGMSYEEAFRASARALVATAIASWSDIGLRSVAAARGVKPEDLQGDGRMMEGLLDLYEAAITTHLEIHKKKNAYKTN